MAPANSTQIQELYVAYFGRAADPRGLEYWVGKKVTTAEFAEHMYAQPEFNSFYGDESGLSLDQQINQIYLNLFNRQADITGLDYWAKQIDAGVLKLATIATNLIYSVQNEEGNEEDLAALTNRTEAADAYTAKINDDVDARLAYTALSNGKGDTEFSAGINLNIAKAYLAGIDKDTEFTEEGIESSVADIADNGIPATTDTHTLTELSDNIVGGSGTDNFHGVLVGDKEAGTTITAGDTLFGGSGSDQLNISVTGDDTTLAVNLVGINADVEKILLSNFEQSVNDTTYDASLSDGLTTVGLTSSSDTGDTVFTGLQNIVDAEMTSGEADLTVTHNDSAVSGDSDTATLTLSGQTAGTFTETSATEGGLEILNVVSEGSENEVDITSARDTITTVNISGGQDLTSTVTSDAIETIDASNLSGELDLTVAGDTDISVTATSGDDTVTFNDGTDLDEEDIVDGGDGTDTLSIANAIAAASDLEGVSNVEVLEVTGANNVTLDADASVMTFDLSDAASQDLTLNDGVTGAVTVTVGEGADDIDNTADVTLTIKGTATAIDDQTSIAGGEEATDTIEITADTDEATEVSIDITAGGIENVDNILVVDAGDNTDADEDDASGKDIEITTGAYATALTIDASALDAANRDDNDDDTIDSDDASEEVLILDGSAATGALTVTGGAGADTITAGEGDDVIDGGAGDDTITATAGGDDNINGGDGDDTIDFGEELDENDVVDGGEGSDTLVVTTLVSGNLAGVTNVETLAFNGSTNLDADLSFDTIDLTEGDNEDSVTFLEGYTTTTTVNVDSGDTVVNDAEISLTVSGTASDFVAANETTITGSADAENDSLTITAESDGDGNAFEVETDDLISNVNSITVVDAGDETEDDADDPSGADFTIDLDGYGAVDDGLTLTIDASALDAANADNNDDDEIDSDDASEEVLTINSVSNTALTVTGGAGADVIGASTSDLGDNLSGGEGDDTFNFAAGDLTYLDIVEGGGGDDTLSVAGAQEDINFMKVSGVETLQVDGAVLNTLGAYFDATGITTVNTDAGAAAEINAAGTTTGITFVLSGAQNEDITAGLGDDFLTVTAGLLTDDDTFDGGDGTDTITLDNSEAAIDADLDLAAVQNVEMIVLSDADGDDDETAELIDINLEYADDGEDTELSLEIDASVITDDNDEVTVDASAVNDEDYSLTISTGDAQDNVTGGSGADTISTGAEDDTIDGDIGDDVIDAGAGDDTITGGAGADTITGGAGDDNFETEIDESTYGDTDVITDFTTGDDEVRIQVTTAADEVWDLTNKGSADTSAAGWGLLDGSTTDPVTQGQYFFSESTSQVLMDVDANGMIQATDFAITLTGVEALADSDIAFDVTTVAGGDGVTLTTGAGADTIVLVDVDDVFNSGDGDDTVSTELAHEDQVLNFGDGTDTLNLTANTADISGVAVDNIIGLEAITLANNAALAVTAAQLTAFDGVANFTVTGVDGTETLDVDDDGESDLDFSSIVYTNAGITLTVDHADDVIETGNGGDTITIDDLDFNGELTLGTGTDTLNVSHANADVVGATITGLDAITLEANTALDITEAQADGSNDIADFAITGTEAGTETIVVAGNGEASALDASDITYTDVAITVTVDDVADVIATGSAVDTFIIAAALDGGAALNLNAGTGAAVDVLDVNTEDAVTLALGTLTGFETLDLEAGDMDVDVTLDAAQLEAFTTVTADADDAITITEMNGATTTASAAVDTFTFGATDAGATISAFTTGGADVLNLDARVVTTDGYSEDATGDADFGAAGFFVLEEDVAGASATMTAADLSAANIVTDSFDNIDGDAMAYFLFKADASEVEDAFVYHVTANSDGDAFASATLVATLTDTADLTDPAFAAGNFAIAV